MLRSANQLVLLIMMGLCSSKTYSQNQYIDSMENDLKITKSDTVKITLLINLAQQYFDYDSIKANQYFEQAHTLALRMNYYYQLGSYYQNKAICIEKFSDWRGATLLNDTAIQFYQKAVDAKHSSFEVGQALLSLATCKGELGGVLVQQGKHSEAIANYIAAIEAWKASDDPRKNEAIGTYQGRIANVYFDLKQFDKALEYDKAALVYRLLDTSNLEAMGGAYVYVADDFNAVKMPDSAMLYLQRAKPYVLKVNKPILNQQYFDKIAKLYYDRKDYKTAISNYKQSMIEARKTNLGIGYCISNEMIGRCYENLEQYDTARKYLLVALPLADKLNSLRVKSDILIELEKVEEKTNHIPQAFIYLKQATVIRDSLKAGEAKKAVAEIENKYQSAEKEKNILQLQKDKEIQSLSLKQRSMVNYILAGFVAVLLIVIYMGYRNIQTRKLFARQQEELQEQRIRELEKDRLLVVVDSMLKGQEEERSRLARDLHDGLGGLLSGVKYSLSNMKDNFIVTPDNMAVFERSLDMIDTSIKELRRVAHNMMPEMLVKFGLDEALKEYCNMIRATKLVAVTYQSFGMETRLDKSTEIIIYRIVQELLNNVLKHAAASEVMVQLVREESRLSIMVEDNGKGFDTNILTNNTGAGWASIRSRVDYLKGQLEVQSKENKGTFVTIELKM